MKLHRGSTKNVLRAAMVGILLEQIRSRVANLGFATPERKWQVTTLRSQLENALAFESLRPYAEAESARRYFKQMERGGATEFHPWRWINLHQWLDLYDA